MSGLLYNECDIDGKPYKFGDWKKYAVHNDKEIKGFFGDYRWLSNFESARTSFEGTIYPSSENAYQAAKVLPNERGIFQTCTAAESKKVWKTLTPLYTPELWDNSKYEIMAVILFDKFYQNYDLRKKLLATGDMYLEETNHWRDTFWGVDIKLGGANNLGKLLMKVREFWK